MCNGPKLDLTDIALTAQLVGHIHCVPDRRIETRFRSTRNRLNGRKRVYRSECLSALANGNKGLQSLPVEAKS